MSTKGHFIYENGIEGFEETSEPQSIFGSFIGYNAYLIIENHVLKSIEMKDQHLIIETKETDKLPKRFKIWGGAILTFDWDSDGLMVALKGGNHITNKIIKNDYSDLIV